MSTPEHSHARAGAPSPGTRARWASLGVLIAAILGAHVALRGLLELEHFGWDTYPLIATSRVGTPLELLQCFTRELMHGRYPLGSFYRPVTSLAFALDHALWGSAPFGYHLTNHLIALAGVVLAFLLARRLAGGWLAPAVAALVFALHPIHFALVPMAARRADMLSALLTMATLVALPRAGARAGLGRTLGCAALAYGAAAAKETGVVALPLVLALAFVGARGAPAERLGRAVRVAWAPCAAVLLFVACRTLVLRGLGGHEGTSVQAALRGAPELAASYANLMVAPRPPELPGAALAALFALVVLAFVTTRARETGVRVWGEPAAGAGAFCALWLALLALVTGLAGEVRTWYGAPFLPLYACTAAALAARARHALGSGRRVAGSLAALACAFLVVWPLRSSGLFRAYDEWPFLSAWEREFLDEAAAALAGATPGSLVQLDVPLPRATRSDLALVRAAGLEGYSVQAWADLTFPDLPVRVAVGGKPVARADEIVLRVLDRPPRQR